MCSSPKPSDSSSGSRSRRQWVRRLLQTWAARSSPVCVDADVLIAGLLFRTGASHPILVLGELGLLRLVHTETAVVEARRNMATKLPEAAPLFREFLRTSVRVRVCVSCDRERSSRKPAPGWDRSGREVIDAVALTWLLVSGPGWL